MHGPDVAAEPPTQLVTVRDGVFRLIEQALIVPDSVLAVEPGVDGADRDAGMGDGILRAYPPLLGPVFSPLDLGDDADDDERPWPLRALDSVLERSHLLLALVLFPILVAAGSWALVQLAG